MTDKVKRLQAIRVCAERLQDMVRVLQNPELNGSYSSMTAHDCLTILKNLNEMSTVTLVRCGQDMDLPMDDIRKAISSTYITATALQ